MNGTTPSLHELWRDGWLVDAESGALLRLSKFEEIIPRRDGCGDAFTKGRSRRVVRWPWAVAKEGEL
ncbi:hypothetical protein [Methylococcus mesophilus]|uniref:hypothetical protein n=1 Tax=Methylococcus mesophilus TaxID=2993564 RepID=UPI00224A68FC|nr:hypothetical protein [Methylococcus mesophilus]UZR29465.1 hypothetical protein OOT43_02190 [Methylococcus mesophilus]